MTTGAAQAVAALVAVLSAQPEPIAATFADAMSRAVGCPRPTCRNTQPPDAAVPTEDGWHIHYRCADCGLRWTEQESNMRSEVPGQSRFSTVRHETMGAQLETAPGGASTPLIQGPRRPSEEID